MRICVTGAAGFIGSHVCDVLLAQGHDVIGIDNLITGSLENLAHIEDRAHFTFVQHDINEPYRKHLGVLGIDQIYNLACPASPPFYLKDPVGTVRTCTVGVMNGLEIAKECGARFFQASTSEIYGEPLVHPQPEDYRGNVSTTGPRACYDEGKRVAESLCVSYRDQFGVDIRIVRIFNTYGPRMDKNDGRVVSNFIVQALSGQSITLYGDGSQTRSFCYVDDNVQGLVALMNTKEDPGPVNIGNPEEYTIKDIAEKIRTWTGGTSEIVYRDLPKDDPSRRRPDITKARKVLGWEPQIGFEEGIKKTINYFKTVL